MMVVGPEARKLIEAQPTGTIDDHAVRIAEGFGGPEWPEERVETVGSTPVGHYDDDDGVTVPMHPAAVVVIGILMLLALAISGGLLVALVLEMI